MAEEITPPAPTPGDGKTGGNGGKGQEDPKNPPAAPKTFTQEELDKVVADRLDREKKTRDKDIADAAKKAREDALNEAKLSDEERTKKQREKDEQERRERDLKITLRENRAEALEELATQDIPKELVDFVVDPDLEKQKTKITTLKKAYDVAVEKGIAKKTAGDPPVDPQKPNQTKKSGVKTTF